MPSVAPSINRTDFSSDTAILIKLSLSLFEMNKLSPFHALTTPCPTIFLSNSSNTNKVSLVANLSKTPLAKGTARSNHV